MKKSTKAALLSGLVFPGVGHMVLRHHLRGSLLMLFALAASSVIINVAVKRAQSIVDSILNGDVPIETGAIMELVAKTSDGSDSVAVTAATIVFGACWLIGVVDSYRVGIGLDI